MGKREIKMHQKIQFFGKKKNKLNWNENVGFIP